jgi:fused signal recognition particle receptor
MFGLFKKFKDGLAKTVAAIAGRTRSLFGGRKIDASSLEELEEALITADFGVETTQEVLAEIKEAYRRDPQLEGKRAAELGAAVLTRVLTGSAGAVELGRRADGRPTVLVMIGVNGSGKTTTTAKLAWALQQQGKHVLVAACDTFRAAAVEQLRSWAERLGLDLMASHTGADAAAVAFDALQAGQKRGKDVVIIDTAGRLHTKSNLMEELAKIRRVLRKLDPEAPHQAWLVVDGSLGSNSIEQARVFHESFGLTGLVVTKLDGTSRGGAVVGIWRALKLPIFYVGLGEQKEDLQAFAPEAYARAVFGLDE